MSRAIDAFGRKTKAPVFNKVAVRRLLSQDTPAAASCAQYGQECKRSRGDIFVRERDEPAFVFATAAAASPTICAPGQRKRGQPPTTHLPVQGVQPLRVAGGSARQANLVSVLPETSPGGLPWAPPAQFSLWCLLEIDKIRSSYFCQPLAATGSKSERKSVMIAAL
jgi:hypothetical protein